MKDPLSFALVLLIAATSLNRGEKIVEREERGGEDKSEERRAAGLVAYPRVGRTAETRSQSFRDVNSMGLVLRPRPGRSGPGSANFYSHLRHDSVPDGELDFGIHLDPEDSVLQDVDYTDIPREVKRELGLVLYPRKGRSSWDGKLTARNRLVAPTGMWFGPRLGRKRERREHRRSGHDARSATDVPWTLLLPDRGVVLGSERGDSASRPGLEAEGWSFQNDA